jgi:hypothetical protein
MSMTRWWLYIQIASISHAKFMRGAHSEVCILGCPGNGLLVPRSQTAPRNALPVPRNRSDIPRNAKIVPGSILAPGNDPAVPGNAGTVPGNAENQNEQVSFPAASHENCSYPRLLDFATGSKKYPRHPTVGCLYMSHPAIRSCTKRAVPKIGDVQRTLSGIGSRSTDTTLAMESCTRTTGTSN